MENLIETINENFSLPSEISIPVIALRGMVMFPNMVLHFDVRREKSILALENALDGDQNVFVVAQKEIKKDEPSKEDIFEVGVIAKVRQIVRQTDGTMRALVEGCQRAKILFFDFLDPFMRAKVQVIPEIIDSNSKNIESIALERKAKDMFIEYLNLSPKISPDVLIAIHAIKNLGQIADFIASNLPLEFEDKQKILEEIREYNRLSIVTKCLAKELDILRMENKLANQLKSSMDQRQREYLLREQMKVISEELGEDDDPRSEANKYLKKLNSLKLSKSNTDKLKEEISRFSKMSYATGESSILRSYLDFCLNLPWNKLSKENYDVLKAEKILDKGHYGLNDVKEHIIEFLSARKLSKKSNSHILCLVGPPGVGKTSIVQSLAKAMGKKYLRISLGGVNDEAEIRGHRKTYMGAMPGRIISAINKAGVRNPIILLDEIDKISKDYHGDPASALLEVLDSEQNKEFNDHFLDLDFDLSDVFFICTANDVSQIPAPLFDRMEVINLYSYTYEEKFKICVKYLIPKQLKKNGLNKKTFHIKESSIRLLIDGYTREAGVRDLDRKISSLMRKAAKLIVTGKKKRIVVDDKTLEKMLGPRRYKKDDMLQKSEVGIVRGLAWTSVGGDTLPIEVSLMKGKGKVQITGSLGDVMKESAQLAVSYIRSNSKKLGIKDDFYKTMDIHIHAPEGAVPKDGPSAGVTMTTALVSALSKTPVKQDVAMTGEITLKGRVLPIGGLREKTMAAYKAGVKTVIIPAGNECDIQKLDDIVKENMKFVTAENLDTVLDNALQH